MPTIGCYVHKKKKKKTRLLLCGVRPHSYFPLFDRVKPAPDALPCVRSIQPSGAVLWAQGHRDTSRDKRAAANDSDERYAQLFAVVCNSVCQNHLTTRVVLCHLPNRSQRWGSVRVLRRALDPGGVIICQVTSLFAVGWT